MKKESYAKFFDEIEKHGVSCQPEEKNRIIKKIEETLSYEPRIGIFGKTGAGKSSLCNALFGQDIAEISDIEACTRKPQEIILGIGTKGLKLIDVPGVGENNERDEEYAELYSSLLPELDLVLWLIKADDRALASDEKFYKHIVKPHLDQGKSFFIVINQIDKIEPVREWNIEKREPGKKQSENIKEKVASISKYFDIPKTKIIPVSASEKYHLIDLVDSITYELPNEKKLTFIQNVKKENISEGSYSSAKKGFWETVWDFITNIPLPPLPPLPFPIPGPWGGGGCFITTATCLALGKGDDCTELNTFRKYRDSWLAKMPGGLKLIKEYYETAPTIVAAIENNAEREAIYDEIWHKHLTPCLIMIENGNNEEALRHYSDMVSLLKTKFFK